MGLKVCKFGGSSLASSQQIRKAINIIQSDDDRRIVVPSAPGKRDDSDTKITDHLYACHVAAASVESFDEPFQKISERFRELAAELGSSLDLDTHLDRLADELPKQTSPDYAASRGEYLNGLLIADVLGYTFIDPATCIRFDNEGRFDKDTTNTLLTEALEKTERAVIPGFFGATASGQIKTFSRGGSDITGSIVARAAQADVYENWSDVNGLLITDPRIVPHAKEVEFITYRELRELSYMGAVVMHEEAVFPVREAGIPVNIRNTNSPEHVGTMILPLEQAPPAVPGSIAGVTGRKDFTVIMIEKAMMNSEIGFGMKVLQVLANHDVSFEHIPSGIDTMSIVVADDEVEGKLDDIIADLKTAVEPDTIDVNPEMALLATVGRGMSQTLGMSAKLFTALSEAGVNIRMIDQGSSELNIIVGIAVEDFETAIKAVYNAFVPNS